MQSPPIRRKGRCPHRPMSRFTSAPQSTRKCPVRAVHLGGPSFVFRICPDKRFAACAAYLIIRRKNFAAKTFFGDGALFFCRDIIPLGRAATVCGPYGRFLVFCVCRKHMQIGGAGRQERRPLRRGFAFAGRWVRIGGRADVVIGPYGGILRLPGTVRVSRGLFFRQKNFFL